MEIHNLNSCYSTLVCALDHQTIWLHTK